MAQWGSNLEYCSHSSLGQNALKIDSRQMLILNNNNKNTIALISS